MSASISRLGLLDLLRLEETDTSGGEASLGATVSVVEASLVDALAVRMVRAAELREIYERRLSTGHLPDDGGGGLEVLLARLPAGPDDLVAAITIEAEGRVAGIWLDTELARLLGYDSGRDARSQG